MIQPDDDKPVVPSDRPKRKKAADKPAEKLASNVQAGQAEPRRLAEDDQGLWESD